MNETQPNGHVATPVLKFSSQSLPNRAEERQKAQLKLSGGSPSVRKQRNSLSGYPILQVELPEDKEFYENTAKLIQNELSNEAFSNPSKAVEKWANHLSSSQLITLCCLLFKRIEAPHLHVLQNLMAQAKNEPAFFFGNLTTSLKDAGDDDSVDSETDTLTKLMASLTTSDSTKKKMVDNSYRKSLPVAFDLGLNPHRYEPFSQDILEDPPQSPQYFSTRPKSFNEDAMAALAGGWIGSGARGPSLTLQPQRRARPKSMLEPGMLSRNWPIEEGVEPSPLPSPVGDSRIWSSPMSPGLSGLHQSSTHQTPFTSTAYNEELRTPGSFPMLSPPEQYVPISPFSPSMPPPRSPYSAPAPPNHARAPMMQTNPSQVQAQLQAQAAANFVQNAKSNFLSFKDKQKRRGPGEEQFAQGARSMFSNIPSPFKLHIMKPHNKVDFDLLQDIPSWLRSLRLHKYTEAFDGMVWQDVIKLTDDDLVNRGISALGARRKMLKHFELVRQELQNKNKVKEK